MDSKQIDGEDADGGKREAASYPYFPLPLALKIADAIKELGGHRVPIQKSQLASLLGESEKSAVLQQRISTAKCFGLIEGRSAFRLSDASGRYYFPTNESEKASALLEFLAFPSSFAEIIKRFDGTKLPAREILANIFHREAGVPTSWKDRTAACFVRSAGFAGALDGAGFLRIRARKEAGLSKPASESSMETMQTTTPLVSGSAQAIQNRNDAVQSIESNVWNFSHKGKAVRLITPTELDRSLWEKLDAYVKLLEPSG